MPHLTVLICTHDRADLLANAVRSLQEARRPQGWSIRVMVAANACRDGTHEWLTQCASGDASGLPVSWFAEPTPGKSNALNSAFPRLVGDLVAFVDDDHRVDDAYFEAVCAAARAHPEAALFCGRILPDWDGTEPPWVHEQGPYRIYPLPVPRFDQGDTARGLTPSEAIPGGGNLAVRTEWLHRVGPFATDLGPSGHDLGGSEDLDWVLRALKSGATLRYVPGMIQYHHVDASRLTLGYLVRKAYKRTASTVRVESGDAGTPRVPRYLMRKIVVYAAKALTAIGSSRRRFYVVRTAAAMGEVAGRLARSRRDATNPSAATG